MTAAEQTPTGAAETPTPNDQREQMDLRDETRDLMRAVGKLARRVESASPGVLIVGTDRTRGMFRDEADREPAGREELARYLRSARLSLSNALFVLDGSGTRERE